MRQQLLLFVFLFLFSSSTSQSITDSLQAHYMFDQNILDNSPFENHLNITEGLIYYSQVNNEDYSLVFDGNLRLTTNFDNSDYEENTIALWLKSNNVTPNLQIMLQGSNMGFGLYLAPNSGKALGFFDGGSPRAYENTNPVTDNEWHHVVITTNGSRTKMYIDGQSDGFMEEPMVTGNGASNNKLYLGKSNLGIQPFTGELNDVRIYNRVLSKFEVNLLLDFPNTYETTSLEEPQQSNFILYPNPAFEFINVTSLGNNKYKIIDLNGRVIKIGENEKINISALESGMYLIRIENGETKSFFKT